MPTFQTFARTLIISIFSKQTESGAVYFFAETTPSKIKFINL